MKKENRETMINSIDKLAIGGRELEGISETLRMLHESEAAIDTEKVREFLAKSIERIATIIFSECNRLQDLVEDERTVE